MAARHTWLGATEIENPNKMPTVSAASKLNIDEGIAQQGIGTFLGTHFNPNQKRNSSVTESS